jgi:hypothetical protein
MELTCWEANTDEASLNEIMSWCLKDHSVDRMLVVLRLYQVGNKWLYTEPKAGEFFQVNFGSYILSGFQAGAWPGTKLLGAPAFVYVLTFNEEVRQVVLRIQPSLTKWQHKENPPLPEDICLFRESDSHPVLVSSTHDLVAWLLSDKTPDVQGFKKTSLRPSSFFPKGKYFCHKYEKRKAGR